MHAPRAAAAAPSAFFRAIFGVSGGAAGRVCLCLGRGAIVCVALQKSDVSIPGVEPCQTPVPKVTWVLPAIIPQQMAGSGGGRQRHGCKKTSYSRSERSRKHTKLPLQ